MPGQLFLPPPRDDRGHVLAVVRSVRRRWRLRMLIRGTAATLLAAALLALVGGYLIDVSRFDAGVVAAVRVLAWLGAAAVLLWGVGRPLLRRVSDERVALYLEEHEPALGGRLISAVELGGDPASGPAASGALVERLVESAAAACRRVDDGKRIERPELWRSSGMLAGSTAFGFALFLVGPAFLHSTLPVLLDPFAEPRAHNPYLILVEPGDVTLAAGADLEVTARLDGFDAADVELAVRGGDDEWSRFSMLRQVDDGEGDGGGGPGAIHGLGAIHSLIVFEVREPTEYFVEASGVRSAVHSVQVMELPYVEDIHLTYHFPPYTGLDRQEQAGSGDVAALAGTEVRLRVTSTLPVPGGVIELEAAAPSGVPREGGGMPAPAERRLLPLRVAGDDKVLEGEITVREPGVYRILLDGPEAAGGRLVASPDYLVDPLADQPPSITLARPGRDIQATALEEVAVEVRAQDDFGVSRVELITSVNGGEEQRATLYRGEPGRRDFAGSHTLFLEELGLSPGDLVSYWARAADASGGGPRHEAVSDIYFLEVRPFDRDFRQADAGGMPGAQGMSGDELTARQRMIIAATFKLARRAGGDGRPDDTASGADLSTVTLSQGRLREDVATLVERLAGRGVVPGDGSELATMAELLPQAAAEMAAAEEALGEGRPGAALAPEQKALRLLQKAEAAFREVRVAQGEGGGGGGGRGDVREELADLFEMERDRLSNQYEQVQRGHRRSVDEALDETLEKLRELARRQQQENERMRARARQAGRGARAGSSGKTQRQIADEAEEAARRLERLARQESLPDLAETARRLRQAAEEMRRAAAAGEQTDEALGSSALDRLRQARRQLERDRSQRVARDTQRAIERTRKLRRQQQRMVDLAERLDPEDPGQSETLRGMMETKERMSAEVGDLEAELDQLSRESRRDQPEASRRLDAAAGEIRDRKIREKILYSRGVVQQRSRDYARNFEEDIAGALGELEDRLREAAGAVGTSREQRLEQALEETREVTTALESLSGRLRPGSEPTEAGAPGGQGSVRPRDFDPRSGPGEESLRQLDRELGRRRDQLEELRGRLEREGVDAADLARIIDRLQGLDAGALAAPETLSVLERDVVQGLKEFEYALRRDLAPSADERVLQVADDDVPDGYEEMVDRYYKALAEERP